MIYFLTPLEGGRFIRIDRKRSIRPKVLVKKFRRQKLKCIVVFRNGMIYDGFLTKICRTDLRHCVLEGKGRGKEYYKQLVEVNMPTEYIQ